MDVYYITLIIVTLFKAKARVDFIFELDFTCHLAYYSHTSASKDRES